MNKIASYSDLPVIAAEYLNYSSTIRGLSIKTVDEYALDLKMFFRYLKLHYRKVPSDTPFDSIDITDIDLNFLAMISLADIYSFMNFLSRTLNDGPATRSRKVSSIKSFFKYLTSKTNQLDHNPTDNLDAPKLRQSLPIFLTLDESLSLLEVVDGPDKERDYAILTLFLNCGMRISELVGINLTDISSDHLRILGKGNKERIVYLNDACLAAIEAYLKVRPTEGLSYEDRNALFISRQKRRISVRMVQTLVGKYTDAAGLGGRKISPHKLRHTAATLMFREGGVDVRTLQEILGHAQLNTTQIYTHISDKQMHDAIKNNPLANVKNRKKDG